jgi:Xaa-Pro aminopeptidase
MKSDIDRHMQADNLDAFLVMGPANHNPPMTYFTGLVHVSDGYLLKKRGEDPILFHFPMEREEAKQTGLRTKNLDDYDPQALLAEADGNPAKARALRLEQIFNEFGVEGHVSLYGSVEIGSAFGMLRETEALLSNVVLVPENHETSVLTRARATKGEAEIERIRKMGEITVSVFSDVAGFLTSHKAKEGILVNRAGQPLTIGEVKRRINLWLAMRGAENPEGTVFAMGREAGIPHSVGQDDQAIAIGKPIVFDLFPCEAGGGYFFDFTRTWCLGYASEELHSLHQDVLEVYQEMFKVLQPGKVCRDYQRLTCELFQNQGHPTIQENPKSEDGYVHSLAHGVGLEVHEAPSFRDRESNHDILQHGSVITLEPGLYYPKRGMGVRLENTLWVSPDGSLEPLADFPMDLVLEVPDA